MKNTEEQTILLIEDNPGDSRLIKEMLKEITSNNYQLVVAETLKEGCGQIRKYKFILILLDLNLPDSSGKQTFDTVIKIAEKTPVVLVSGLLDEELSLSLIEEGAQDYILKQDLNHNLLSKTIQYALIRKKAEEELKASKDFLDKIINSVASPIFVKDDQHRFCLANNALCSLLNLSVEKLIGTTDYEYFPEEQIKVFLAKDQEVFRTGKENINEELLTDGTGKIQNIVTRKTLYTDTDGNKFLVGVINDITENRQKENELTIAKEQAEESRNKFQSIFLFAPTGIGVVKDRVISEVNQKLLEITGYPEGDLIGQSALILYPSKAEYDYVWKERYLNINETSTGTVETKWRKKDGTIIDVEISSNSIFGEDLHNDLTFTALDVTSRKLSEAIFKDIIEKNPLSIQILNMDGYTIQTNSAHTRLFGATPPAGYSIFKDTQLLEQGLGELFNQIKSGEIVHFPDSYFNAHDVDPSFPDVLAWIKATGFALNDSNGVPERIVLMHEDITARKYAEAMFEDIVDKNPLSIQIVDKDGYTITGNPAYLKLFGSFPPSGFSIFADLMGKSPEVEKLILLAQSGQVAHLPDTYYNPKDISPDFPDNPVWIRALIFPLNDSTGKPVRYILMHENITERKQAENEIRLLNETLEQRIAERTIQLVTVNKELAFHLSELEQFSYISNHDLQEPLRTLTQFTQLLNEKYAGTLDEEGTKYIQFISQSAVRMSVLVKDLLEYSILGKESVKTLVDCNKIIDVVLGDLDDSIIGSSAKLTVQHLPILNGYETELRLLFQNLLENAIKYQENDKVPEIIISAKSLEKEWLFSIKDNGIGIDQKYDEKIFIIFQRLHNRSEFEGTGIGLAHCKKIVEMHGGRIWVESTPGQGSVFLFTIPKG